MRAIVVNCSSGYNVAVHRLAAWLEARGTKAQVFERWPRRRPVGLPADMDLALADHVYLSAIFSWDLPVLADVARRALTLGKQVEIGGPAAEVNAVWVEEQTGVAPWRDRCRSPSR